MNRQIFGWSKVIGGLRKVRVRGTDRVDQVGHFVAAAYNLMRMAKLRPIPG